MTGTEYHREQAENELVKSWQVSGDSVLDEVLAHGLAAVTHALMMIAGRSVELEPLRGLQRTYKDRQTHTRYGGQSGPHAAGYALAMKHAEELLSQVIGDPDAH
jgi:hypothetical protein